MNQQEIKSIIDQISYKDWMFKLGTKGNVLYLQIVFFAPDNDWPEHSKKHSGRKWMLSSHMTRSEIVLTALKAVLTAEEHEAREQFRYKGQAVFNPHFDIEAWLSLAEEDILDVRPAPPENDSPPNATQAEEGNGRKPKTRITDNRNQTP